MNEDTRILLKRKGFVWNAAKQAYEKSEAMATRLPQSQPQSDSGLSLEHHASVESGSSSRVKVRIIRRACRLLDADNMAGGCKFIIDALRHAGLIENDDPESVVLELEQEQVATKKEEGTEILITESI